MAEKAESVLRKLEQGNLLERDLNLLDFEAVLWRFLSDRLDAVGKAALDLYNHYMTVMNMLDKYGEHPRGDAAAMLEGAKMALRRSLDGFLSAIAADRSASGPGGIRTHDPHNAEHMFDTNHGEERSPG